MCIRDRLITRLDNLSIYWQEDTRRRSVIDNPKRDRIENFESVNEAYVVEDYRDVYKRQFLLSPASSGGLLLMSCRCMKTTTQSGQAWRGYERA